MAVIRPILYVPKSLVAQIIMTFIHYNIYTDKIVIVLPVVEDVFRVFKSYHTTQKGFHHVLFSESIDIVMKKKRRDT